MGDLMRIAGLALVLTVLLSYLRSVHASWATQVGMAFMIMTLLILMRHLQGLISFFLDLGRSAGVPPAYTTIVLRAVGVGYLASFVAQLAKDAKEDTVAHVVELTGKIFITLLAIPVVKGILEVLMGVLP